MDERSFAYDMAEMGIENMVMERRVKNVDFRTSNLAWVRFFSFRSSCGMRRVCTPCTFWILLKPLRNRMCR